MIFINIFRKIFVYIAKMYILYNAKIFDSKMIFSVLKHSFLREYTYILRLWKNTKKYDIMILYNAKIFNSE